MYLSKSRIAFAILSLLSVCMGAHALKMPFPFAVLETLNNQKSEKNLIMVLDVKQQEWYPGACASIMEYALKDKIAPMLASAHALEFVKGKFKPSEWHIYTLKNLVLFIPKDYLREFQLTNPENAGFNLNNWKESHLNYDSISGSDFYQIIADNQLNTPSFYGISKESVQLIRNSFKKDPSNKWKIYLVGHGAPDAHQICGLDIEDFKDILQCLNNDINTDFLVYQTCFGGSKNQLKAAYKENQDIYSTFKFPIISGCLTNSVSFAFRNVSFKGIFTKLNNSSFVEKKTRRILKAVNEINKCLDAASDYHWTNNLLLVRMPGNQYFEPVVDNKAVFKGSEMPAMNEKLKGICADNEKFKCILIDKPIIKGSLDLQSFSNFIVCSGLSRQIQYIEELKLPAHFGTDLHDAFGKIGYIFCSLAFPEADKTFYINRILVGDTQIAKNVTIVQEQPASHNSSVQTISIESQSNHSFYGGKVYFYIGSGLPSQEQNTCMEQDALWGANYMATYNKGVTKQLQKQHHFPFFVPSAVDEVFSVVEEAYA